MTRKNHERLAAVALAIAAAAGCEPAAPPAKRPPAAAVHPAEAEFAAAVVKFCDAGLATCKAATSRRTAADVERQRAKAADAFLAIPDLDHRAGTVKQLRADLATLDAAVALVQRFERVGEPMPPAVFAQVAEDLKAVRAKHCR